MFVKFHNKNFFVVPLKSWAIDVMMELPAFFPVLRYDQMDDYGILYQDGLDFRACLIEYLNYSIEYNQKIIEGLSEPRDSVNDFSDSFAELIGLLSKEIADLRESRLRITD